MSSPGCNDLADEIILHEILGVGKNTGTEVTVKNGYVVFNDPSRGGKELTVTRLPYEATKKGRAKNVTLQAPNGVALTKTGFRMPHAGTICLIVVNNDRTNTFTLHVRKNGSLTNIHSLSVVAATGAHDKLVDVDFSEGDVLEFYIEGLAHHPIARIEVAWRP